MRSFFVPFTFLLGTSAAAGPVNLDAPIATILSSLTPGDPRVAQNFFDQTGQRASTPIRTFVLPKFYEAHVRRRRIARPGNSPFFYEPTGWEDDLALALAHRELTFAMSPAEIRNYEQKGSAGPLFKSLYSLDVRNEAGHAQNLNPLTRRGSNLIKDFVRLYDEEMRLPEARRLISSYRSATPKILLVKRVVDVVVARACDAELSAVRVRGSGPLSN